MKNFSVRSAWTTFQWMLLTNRRQLLVYLAGFTVAAFALDEFCLMKFSNILEDGRVVEPAAWGLGFMPYFYIWAMSLWMVYGASRTFVFAKNRQSAITLLMHPASNLEKYVALLLYSCPLWACVAFVGLVAGDSLRCVVNWAFGLGEAPHVLAVYYRDFNRFLPYAATLSGWDLLRVMAFAVAFCFHFHSLYVLGSAFFRRHRFLSTSVALFVFGVLLAGSSLSGLFYHLFPDSEWQLPALTVFYVVSSVVFYWLAYLIFRRIQVINNRWINI